MQPQPRRPPRPPLPSAPLTSSASSSSSPSSTRSAPLTSIQPLTSSVPVPLLLCSFSPQLASFHSHPSLPIPLPTDGLPFHLPLLFSLALLTVLLIASSPLPPSVPAGVDASIGGLAAMLLLLLLLFSLASLGAVLGCAVVVALAGVSSSVGASVERATVALARLSRGRQGRRALGLSQALSSLAIATPQSALLLLAALDDLHPQRCRSPDEGEEVREEVQRAIQRACATLTKLGAVAAVLFLLCIDLAGSGRLWEPTPLHRLLVQAQPYALWALAGAVLGGALQEWTIRRREKRLNEEVDRLQPILGSCSAGLLDDWAAADCSEDVVVPITEIAIPQPSGAAAAAVITVEAVVKEGVASVSVEAPAAEDLTCATELLSAV